MNTIARCLVVAAGLFIFAASPAAVRAAPAADDPAGDTITFAQYRDWRMHFIEARQLQIAAELAQKNLSSDRRAGLERQKSYYDFFATMAAADRDRLFRERFDEIDTNHDGIIDAAERTAWHEKQRAFYDRSNTYRHETAASAPGRR